MKKLAPKRRILIVGEGRETEYNYFVGFRNTFQHDLEATATSIRVVRGRGGNARNIVEHAIKEAKKFQPDRKRGDRVFLLLDTEGESRAAELPAAQKLATQSHIEIIFSSPAIEYWFLCHFESISKGYYKDCCTVISDLNKKWNQVCKSAYHKADYDIFGRLSEGFDRAREQALQLDLHHLTATGFACGTNPSTQIYELIAFLIGARTGAKCPLAGTWKLVGNETVTIQLKKGELIPSCNDKPAHWQL